MLPISIKRNRTKEANRLERPLPLDPETRLYSRNFFFLRLNEERERTKRTENIFSLLIVDLDGISTILKEKSRGSTQIHDKKLVEAIVSHSRKIDIKGWFDLRKVGIIMVNTEESGALEVKEKICHQIEKNWPFAESLNLDEFFQVYTFGADSLNGNDPSSDGGHTSNSRSNPEDNALFADILSTNLLFSFRGLAKRILDIIGSLLGLIVTSPLMLIIAVSIKLTSPGPILFRQKRVGFLGRRFTFLKFRSMVVNADHKIHERYVTDLIKGRNDKVNHGTKDRPLYKMTNDPRVTPIGRVLRKTSLDELPQLFNILKGDMSLVGPRPPIPYETKKYRLWHYGRVLEVKPGLTGLWQISGRSATFFDDMVRLDLRYANNWSLWLDIKIILKTFRAVLSAEGAW